LDSNDSEQFFGVADKSSRSKLMGDSGQGREGQPFVSDCREKTGFARRENCSGGSPARPSSQRWPARDDTAIALRILPATGMIDA